MTVCDHISNYFQLTVIAIYLAFLSNAGPNNLKKFSFDSELFDGTESSNVGSTLSYERRFVGCPSVSQAA